MDDNGAAVMINTNANAGFFSGGGSREAAAAATTTAKTQAQQLSDLREIANNNKFLSDINAVIAEADEVIAIASRVQEVPPKNRGGGVQQPRLCQRQQGGRGGRVTATPAPAAAEENLWFESLRSLLKKPTMLSSPHP